MFFARPYLESKQVASGNDPVKELKLTSKRANDDALSKSPGNVPAC